MGYVRTPAVPPLTSGATCDNCDAEIDTLGFSHAIDALEIFTSGGYGQFYDGNLSDGVFCDICAKRLVEAFPGIQKIIDRAIT